VREGRFGGRYPLVRYVGDSAVGLDGPGRRVGVGAGRGGEGEARPRGGNVEDALVGELDEGVGRLRRHHHPAFGTVSDGLEHGC